MHRDASRTAHDALSELATAIQVLTGRGATDTERQHFSRYLELIVQWNRAQRLTGAQSPWAIVRDLFRDSLLFLTQMPPASVRVVDIGAGAGIPGIPLRIARPEISLTLIEAKRKRVSFLATVKRELGFQNVTIEEGRAEQLVARSDLAAAFDVAVARAVGSLPSFLANALAYLKPGGLLIVAGAPDAAVPTISAPGAELEIAELTLDQLGIRRRFIRAHKRAS